jgi:hypothetical protein
MQNSLELLIYIWVMTIWCIINSVWWSQSNYKNLFIKIFYVFMSIAGLWILLKQYGLIIKI